MENSGSLYPSKPELDLHNGKFTNGDASAGVMPSVLDANTLNLILDNLSEAIKAFGLVPDNKASSIGQLKKSLLWAAGHWQEDMDAVAGQTILHSGVLYLCNQNHKTTAAKAPTQEGAPWALLATDESIAKAIRITGNNAESYGRTYAKLLDNDLETKLNNVISNTKASVESYADTQDDQHDWALETKLKNWVKALFPAGTIYINTYSNTNPAALFGFGSWSKINANAFIGQAGNNFRLGYYRNQAAPDITGTMFGGIASGNGAFEYTRFDKKMGYTSRNGYSRGTIVFRASNSNSTYSNDSRGGLYPYTLGGNIWYRIK